MSDMGKVEPEKVVDDDLSKKMSQASELCNCFLDSIRI
jgi:hypothetical protein